ncbi:hypothetical protein DdX_08965 [Ditylenchus destructor]|uniref:Uncharacterized protein n=1 Tax=Ditylenchus destructor TaxID=166010 RepID=A0AAD4N1L9_9BILA|nr:hypothetical protein DdX_08965 [Ditylenchus destructor]
MIRFNYVRVGCEGKGGSADLSKIKRTGLLLGHNLDEQRFVPTLVSSAALPFEIFALFNTFPIYFAGLCSGFSVSLLTLHCRVYPIGYAFDLLKTSQKERNE